jgi:hypothetical protein
MSIFGERVALANQITDLEMADDFIYQPMKEVVNADPLPDPTRTGGACRVIVLDPGIVQGSSWSLRGAMHERSTSEITLYYMAKNLLTDVRRKDRFILDKPNTNPYRQVRYEVSDGPRPIGFGRFRAVMVELPWDDPDDPLPTLIDDRIPF